MQEKRLIIRLSSLGDVILSTSSLEALPVGGTVDWVVSKEYAPLLNAHPKLNRIFEFDRDSGLKGWIALCRTLWEENYTEVLDLHRNLRSKILKILFIYWSFAYRKASFPSWKTIQKQRVRLYGYFIFKSLWPKAWRPTPWVKRYSLFVGGSGNEHPDLRYLLNKNSSLTTDHFRQFLEKIGKPYICVMPSSQWEGKNWSVEQYCELLKRLPYLPVILGTNKDQNSLNLCAELAKNKFTFYSGVGIWNILETAAVLSESAGYIGGDTGLAHLSEALRVSAHILYGPTNQDMGFGPWQKMSRAYSSKIWCQPCGKDGRYCFRLNARYSCLRQLSPEMILEKMR